MKTISLKFENVDDFLALDAELVAFLMLEILTQNFTYYIQHGCNFVEFVDLQRQDHGDGGLYGGQSGGRWDEVTLALGEGWNWLEGHGFLAPHPKKRGSSMLTRRAKSASTPEGFEAYRQALSVPWRLVHPTICDIAQSLVLKGLYDSAILESFKRVEVAVRAAGGYPAGDIGVPLMRKAFKVDPPGRLTDPDAEEGEKEAIGHLFAGAMGYLKNPQSHKIVGVDELTQAVESIMFASHLLRIVDERGDAFNRRIHTSLHHQ